MVKSSTIEVPNGFPAATFFLFFRDHFVDLHSIDFYIKNHLANGISKGFFAKQA